MAVIHYLIYYILVFISLYIIIHNYDVPKTLTILNIGAYIIFPIVAQFTRLFKCFLKNKDFKPKSFSLVGLYIFVFTLFMIMLMKVGQDSYIPVARTNDIEQVYKIQNVLLEHYTPIRINRIGNRYDIEIAYNKQFLEYAPAIIAESDIINENTRIVVGIDYDDLHTLEERIEKQFEKTIPHITGVYNATVDLNLHLNTNTISTEKEPVKAKVIIETDKTFNIKRIEKTIKNLMLSSIFDLEEKNLEIEIKVNE